jgi:hypothetical protein
MAVIGAAWVDGDTEYTEDTESTESTESTEKENGWGRVRFSGRGSCLPGKRVR